MSQWSETRRPAMKIEEAALLPALPKRRLAGGTALRDALHAAEAMDNMRLSNEVEGGIIRRSAEDTSAAPVYSRPGQRAALHHVLRK